MRQRSTTSRPPDGPNRVVEHVERILADGIARRASDIHFEPADRCLRVRYRIDGLLVDVEELPLDLAEQAVARLKVLAGLLTYRIDVPQEGSLTRPLAMPQADADNASPTAALDLRVATFPTIRGERAVVRVMYASEELHTLDQLGFSNPVAATLRAAIEAPNGMILITGPAGAGKSTTLYALIRHLLAVTPGRSVVALEDPVEQRVAGVTQIQINPHGELDYARAMRSLLRQDPQVLLVGEIRDAATAELVMEAALTGHLLLSTMHSGEPAEAIIRLLEMGLPPYQIVSTLSVVATQRLVRTLCPACREPTGDPEAPYVRRGCEQCHHTGYHGRTVLGQTVTMDDSLRERILHQPTTAQLRDITGERSTNLHHDADRVIRAGLTDRDEVLRILGRSPHADQCDGSTQWDSEGGTTRAMV